MTFLPLSTCGLNLEAQAQGSRCPLHTTRYPVNICTTIAAGTTTTTPVFGNRPVPSSVAAVILWVQEPGAITWPCCSIRMDGQGPPQDTGPKLNLTPVLRGVDIFFIIASTIIVLGRLYSRFIYKKNASYDDYVAVLAWVSCNHSNRNFAGAERPNTVAGSNYIRNECRNRWLVVYSS